MIRLRRPGRKKADIRGEVSEREPFERLPFEALPERPRRPHPYLELPARRVEVASQPFGRVGVHVRETGDGPPLLLVHGLMTSGYSFRHVVGPLAERFRVVVPDLVGAGRSDKPTGVRYGAPELASFLTELVDALDIRGCRTVGNSLGGYLCMRAALDDPSLFGCLVNIHSPGVPEARLRALHLALRMPGMRALLAAVIRRDPERWAHRHVHYYDETLKSLEEAREYGAPLRTAEGRAAFLSWLGDGMAPGDLAAFVRRLEERKERGEGFPVPLLLVYARRDAVVPPEVGNRLSELVPGAPLEWLERSSHFAHVDTPDELLGRVLPFLEARSTG